MSGRKRTPRVVVDSYKHVHAITRNLQTVLNINTENATEEDVNKILNLTLPMKQIDNLIKITKHTNENLEITKSNLLKNRNLMAEEISCLNECFGESSCSVTETEDELEAINSTTNNSQSEVPKLKSDEEDKDLEEDLSEENMSFLEYEAKKLIAQQKKKKKEVLVSPPMMDITKLK